MKKILFCIVALVAMSMSFASCDGCSSEPVAADSTAVDTLATDTTVTDTLATDTAVIDTVEVENLAEIEADSLAFVAE